jgi:acyl-coenzyme A thioesterase 13
VNQTVQFFKTQIGKIIDQSPSPVGNWLQAILIEVEEGSISADVKVRKEMTNPVRTLHGGMIAAIADEMIGATIATLELPHVYVSVNLHTDFLFPVKEGETVRAKSEIIRRGKNIIHTECRIYNSDNKLVAKSSANNIKINEKN